MQVKCPDGWKPIPNFTMARCQLCGGESPIALENQPLQPIKHKADCPMK